MKSNEQYRVEKYKQRIAEILPIVLAENLNGSKYDLVKQLKLRTIVKIKGFVYPSNIQSLCEEAVLDTLREQLKIDKSPILPNTSLRTESMSDIMEAKRIKTIEEATSDEFSLNFESIATLSVVETFVGNETLMQNLAKCFQGILMRRFTGLLDNAFLITGDKGFGKTEVVRFSAKYAFQCASTTNNVSEGLILSVRAIDILRHHNINATSENRYLQYLQAKVLALKEPLLLFFDDIDLLFSNCPSRKKEISEWGSKKCALLLQDFIDTLEKLLTNKTNLLVLMTAQSRAQLDSRLLSCPHLLLKHFNLSPLNISQQLTVFRSILKRYQLKGLFFDLDDYVSSKSGIFSGWAVANIVSTAKCVVANCVTRTLLNENEVSSIAVDFCDKNCVTNNIKKFTVAEIDIDIAFDDAETEYVSEGFLKIPNVKLEHVGGMCEIKTYVRNQLIDVIINLAEYKRMGLQNASGLLLWGPPGCGKTYLAKAIANACNARFMLVNGSELLDKYVGQSERRIRELFERARNNTPCLIFFDEFDALCPSRDSDNVHDVSKRIVNSLLAELDGVVNRAGVFVLAATNRPNLIDSAILRSGRFEHKIYVAPPDFESRKDIIKVVLQQKNWHMSEIDKEQVARFSEKFSSADLNFALTHAAADFWRQSNKQAEIIKLTYENVKVYLKQPTIDSFEISDKSSATFDKV